VSCPQSPTEKESFWDREEHQHKPAKNACGAGGGKEATVFQMQTGYHKKKKKKKAPLGKVEKGYRGERPNWQG